MASYRTTLAILSNVLTTGPWNHSVLNVSSIAFQFVHRLTDMNVIGTSWYVGAGPPDMDCIETTFGRIIAAENSAIFGMTSLHFNTKCTYNDTITTDCRSATLIFSASR